MCKVCAYFSNSLFIYKQLPKRLLGLNCFKMRAFSEMKKSGALSKYKISMFSFSFSFPFPFSFSICLLYFAKCEETNGKGFNDTLRFKHFVTSRIKAIEFERENVKF